MPLVFCLFYVHYQQKCGDFPPQNQYKLRISQRYTEQNKHSSQQKANFCQNFDSE